MQPPAIDELVRGALDRDRFSIARLITLFEDGRPDAPEKRRSVLAALRDAGRQPAARIIGITGTPGAGKSTLIGELATRLIAASDDLSIAVLAVDPTSPTSGGSLLGDRTRVQFPLDEPRLFFRSQPSRLELGGLGRDTFQAVRLLVHLYDALFIETVGIGQSEIEIRDLADRTYLVMQPLAGDQIQFMKAGIMEIPDAFVINKADAEQEARRTLTALRSIIRLARPGHPDERTPIFLTSCRTGRGLDELTEDMLSAIRGPQRSFREREQHFFAR
ncbi:MAG: protein kinase, partial [Candidatus Dadabacteria bacterium]